MTSKQKIIISIILIITSTFIIFKSRRLEAQNTLVSRLQGKILLQVEDNGEAWYIYPYSQKRYYLGRPADAFQVMRDLGLGITNNDLAKIPLADANFEGVDTDQDGLPDALEDSLGTDKNSPDTDQDGYSDKEEILNNFNPTGNNKINIDSSIINRMSGLIALQVESNGEAWYINPDDNKRYYLGRPVDAFNLMRKLGLGITNQNLALIPEYKIDPEYTEENIVNKLTQFVNETINLREYTDPLYKYSFNYPGDWNIKKFPNDTEMTQISDAEEDYLTEDKGVIALYYFKTEEEHDLDTFYIADKDGIPVLSDKELLINSHAAMEKAFEHKLVDEKITTIQISPKEFIRISLANVKANRDYYEGVYNDVIESLQFNLE